MRTATRSMHLPRIIRFLAILGCWLASLAALAGPASANLYNLYDFGPQFDPVAINNQGQVVGNYSDGSVVQAALYSGGVLTPLGALSGGSSISMATLWEIAKTAGNISTPSCTTARR